MVIRWFLLIPFWALFSPGPAAAEFRHADTAVEKTAGGDLFITPLHHAGVLFQYNGATFCIDPYALPDGLALPRADLVLLTHFHPDHFDPASLKKIAGPATVFIVPRGGGQAVGGNIPHAETIALDNGKSHTFRGISIRAIPAYNLMGRDATGAPYHPAGQGNGYLLDFQGFRVYLAGDTEKIRDMEKLGPVDVAFLPALKPYCLDEPSCLAALKDIKPKIFYPYHYVNPFNRNRSDVGRVAREARKMGIEVRLPAIY